jgi:peptidoglycan L-alanyl-D-glutamate endopeptidase CwlK
MAKFSETSKNRLDTCDKKLQDIFNEVIKHYDCTIICGARSDFDQQKAFKEGKSKNDGIIKKSKHQTSRENPYSQAVDVAPFHARKPNIDWNCLPNFYIFAGYVLRVAHEMNIKIRWGGSWDGTLDVRNNKFNDLVHFELEN